MKLLALLLGRSFTAVVLFTALLGRSFTAVVLWSTIWPADWLVNVPVNVLVTVPAVNVPVYVPVTVPAVNVPAVHEPVD